MLALICHRGIIFSFASPIRSEPQPNKVLFVQFWFHTEEGTVALLECSAAQMTEPDIGYFRKGSNQLRGEMNETAFLIVLYLSPPVRTFGQQSLALV